MKLTLFIDMCPAGCNMEGQKHQFGTEGGSFGRAADNNWVLPDPSRYVSSRHGQISCDNNQFVLTDVSTNGIYLNDSVQPLGANNRSVLNNGDRLIFGDYQIQVTIEKAANKSTVQSSLEESPTSIGGAVKPENSVSLDDLDKWLEPSPPASESIHSAPASINTSSSPSVKSTGDIDLGLRTEEKDPLSLLGSDKRDNALPGLHSSSKIHSSPQRGELNDILGATSPLDRQMMKVPGVIPDDWDDLLGVRTSDKSASEPATQVDPGATSLDYAAGKDLTEPVSPEPETEVSKPAAAISDLPPKNLPDKAPEGLGLSELLAMPADQLPSNDRSGAEADTPPVADVKPLENRELENDALVSAAAGVELAQALGLERLSEEQQKILNDTVANTVKETVSGMMRTLRARSEIKSEFRLNMTTIQSAENNPLKFSVTPEDAIENMFTKQGRAYLSPTDAIKDGFADISDHQVALFDAMKAAYEHILGQFDPVFLARKFEKTSSKRLLGGSKGKNWDAYQALFEEYKEDKEATFKELFGSVFADAYERRMHSLKMSRNSLKGNKHGN